MVLGATYYVKFQSNPAISLTGYTGHYQVFNKAKAMIGNGDLVIGDTYAELSYPTEGMTAGDYNFRAFLTFPDGFIQNIHDETVSLT